MFGLVVFLVSAPGQWTSLPLFLPLGLLTGLILVGFSVLVGSLAFWMGNADNLAAQVTFSLYPVDIFPDVVKALLYTLIPAIFVGSMPTNLLNDFSWARLAILVSVSAGFTLAAQ